MKNLISTITLITSMFLCVISCITNDSDVIKISEVMQEEIKQVNDSNYKIDSNAINLLVAKNLIDKIGASIEFINEIWLYIALRLYVKFVLFFLFIFCIT